MRSMPARIIVTGRAPWRTRTILRASRTPACCGARAGWLSSALARSWLVGDRASDIEAAKRAGLAGALHVQTGYGRAESAAALALSRPGFDVRAAASIAGALMLPLFQHPR